MFRKAAVWIVLAVGLMCQSAFAGTEAPQAADKGDQTAAATTPSSELYFPQNLVQALSTGGAVAVVLAVVVALVTLVAPMFGVRYCQLLGNCDNTYPYSANNAAYQNDMYGQYPQASYPTGNSYKKRSVEYVGPVLHMLKAAYDKYGLNTMATTPNKSS